ncbi:uncharacterized protein SPPG_03120 [Spizellomyces punctatus DAOM BR117]|uniref:Uncharacterized protein n=1 Tax=Spizellomyces punctatus (strain DAOM BR117) TaxID=645134 RepID=A0A0L0HK91_SPIPD|nr:uncharacterized protein SPPG_03120 [Spizellomyces punctatus DAOM BR117]KND01310.1 hypothetical protein SPPG_03120 [Spizellomyces punctatus DAOM BR117]|eukprot:XP_016609349.1 hypothetical protein SPPG_03120 [Spizellomyces punctatus DAOM BR117]
MADIASIESDEGATITVCAAHQYECCPFCCLDFFDVNNEARNAVRMSKAVRPPSSSLGDGRLRTGKEVRMLDRSGTTPPNHLDGRITGIMIEKDEESDFEGLLCYVIEYNGSDKMTYPVDWVHEEWMVNAQG